VKTLLPGCLSGSCVVSRGLCQADIDKLIELTRHCFNFY